MHEIFCEVALFGNQENVANKNGYDCGCYSCDGNPCVKVAE